MTAAPRTQFIDWRTCLVGLLVTLQPCLAHGDLHDRIAAVTRRIVTEPGNARLHVQRAELHRLHRDWAGAKRDLRRAETLDPTLDDVHVVRARMLRDRGDLAEALRVTSQLVARRADQGAALEIHAKLLLALGRTREAAAAFDPAIASAPAPRPDLCLLRARTLQKIGPDGPCRALASLEEALALGPVASLEVEAMELEALLGRFDAALKRVDRLMSRATRRDGWLERRANLLERAGRHRASRTAARAALDALRRLPPRLRKRKDTRQRSNRLSELIQRTPREIR